jgi:hypothetical protein
MDVLLYLSIIHCKQRYCHFAEFPIYHPLISVTLVTFNRILACDIIYFLRVQIRRYTVLCRTTKRGIGAGRGIQLFCLLMVLQ